MPLLGTFVIHEMGLATIYPCTKFEFLASPVFQRYGIGAVEWLGVRGGVPKLARGSLSSFYVTHQIWR